MLPDECNCIRIRRRSWDKSRHSQSVNLREVVSAKCVPRAERLAHQSVPRIVIDGMRWWTALWGAIGQQCAGGREV